MPKWTAMRALTGGPWHCNVGAGGGARVEHEIIPCSGQSREGVGKEAASGKRGRFNDPHSGPTPKQARTTRLGPLAAVGKRPLVTAEQHTVMDLTGHTLSVVPDPGLRSTNASHCQGGDRQLPVAESQEAHLQDLMHMKHIACAVHMRNMILQVDMSTAAFGEDDAYDRRAEIKMMLKRL